MTGPSPTSLGAQLAPLVGGGFFRPLSRPTAAVYIDCADRLVESVDEGGKIPHDEARVLIRDVLARHPDVQLDEDEGGLFRDLNQRAATFFNKLLEAHWLDARRVSLDEHYVLITPSLRRLIRTLREMAEVRPEELKDFAATLQSICRDLVAPGALDPARMTAEEMRQTVKELVQRVERAEDQMHAVENLIIQHENAQRISTSAQDTLERFLVEFHAGEHMVCYDALQESGLLPRLNQARSAVQEAAQDPFTKQRLAEGIAAHLGWDPTDAYAEAERWFGRLERLLAVIPVKQRIIDGRIADFSKLSAARYRYQTEMRGRHSEQVKAYLDHANSLHHGCSFADLADEPGMELLSPEVKVYFGVDSLSRPRRSRPLVNLSIDSFQGELDPEQAKDEIRRRNLNILTPQRAARFVERYLPEKGAKVSTADLRVGREDDLLDLLAVLAFDRGASSGSGRSVRWKVHAARGEFGTDPAAIPRDPEADRMFERLTLERTH